MKHFSLFAILLFLGTSVSLGCWAPTAGTRSTSQIQDRQDPVAGNQNEKIDPHPGLTDPKLANKQAPEKFRVKFETTKGDIIVEVTREWSPNGADRFYNLVDVGFFKDIAIFRAVPNFMFQFGIHGNPKVSEIWRDAKIKDDPRKGISNSEGTMTYAMGGPNTRTTQFFINLKDNDFLDGQGFTPFGKVVEGMDVVKKINTEYGENAPDVQQRFQSQGNAYILKRFPNLDMIKSLTLVEAE
jgi:peptidyl-prolyl cis-trans isomerase A (cyclophilin A)